MAYRFIEAIANNGYVEIEFYNEEPIIPQRTFYGGTGTVTWTNYNQQPITYTTSNSGTFTLTGVNTTSTSNAFYNASSNTQQVSAKSLLNDSKMETGVTEKGGSTSQTFTQSDRNFYSYSFWNVAWRILPNSHKQYHAEEVNVMYCGECGAKRKKDTHKFCPHCGTKY